ncbi:MAG: ThuA domain-containing protein [Deltaproteobacteria bacterium]
MILPTAPAPLAGPPRARQGVPVALLLFSKTTDYRHASIPAGIAALSSWAQRKGLHVEATEDGGWFEPERLARFAAVVWLSTSGSVLDAEQRRAFEAFLRAGGAYVGIHSASASEPDWPWYAELVGARFTEHPMPQRARLVVEDREHAATCHLGSEWWRSDEWYEFDRNPRAGVRVLLSVDESSYQGGTSGDHPLAWCRELDGTRSFYTALGHSPTDFEDATFLQHLGGGIEWALGAAP